MTALVAQVLAGWCRREAAISLEVYAACVDLENSAAVVLYGIRERQRAANLLYLASQIARAA